MPLSRTAVLALLTVGTALAGCGGTSVPKPVSATSTPVPESTPGNGRPAPARSRG